MPRFFVEETIGLEQTDIRIANADFHHIRDVLRMRPGEQLVVCDNARVDLTCEIKSFEEHAVVLKILTRTSNRTEPLYEAVLYQGLAKGDKMDTIIQKAVELGASRIVPVRCRRSVVKIDAKTADKKVSRWSRIAAEAAKQCGRGNVPAVAEPMAFEQAAAEAVAADLALIPWEGERTQGIRTVLEQQAIVSKQPVISIMIGPEGGFDADEIKLAASLGIRPVSLGPRILRTETAGLAVLSMLVYRFDGEI